MDAFKKNSVVARMASAKHFDKDREHYMKVFPASPIIPSLKMAQSFSKKSLDERMLFELLDHVCEETIQEYRGLKPKEDPETVARNKMIAAQKAVLTAEDVAAIDLKQLKYLVADLGLDVPDQKQETLIGALGSYKEAMADGDEKKDEDKAKAAEIVMNTDDIADIDYNDMRGLVADLDINTPDQKKETLTNALIEFKEANAPAPAKEDKTSDESKSQSDDAANNADKQEAPAPVKEDNKSDESKSQPTDAADNAAKTEASAPATADAENPETDKKKEGPKPNTQA